MFNHWKALKRKEEGKACQRLAVSLQGMRELPEFALSTQLFLSLGSSIHCFLSCLQVVTLHYPLVPTPLLCKLSFDYIPIKSWWVWSDTDIYALLLVSHFSHVWLFVTPWPAAHQAPLSMWFSRQEYWSGLPCPSPHICTTISKIDNLQGPTIEHRELCSIFYNNPNGKIIWKIIDTCIYEIPWTEEPGRLQSLGSPKSGTQLSD